MVSAIQQHVRPGSLRLGRPTGGLYLWCRLAAGVSARALLDAAIRQGVAFVPGDAFYPDPAGESELRLCFSSVLPKAIDDAIRKFASSLNASAPAVRADMVAIA
jgi:2-aminoadipate transaminase